MSEEGKLQEPQLDVETTSQSEPSGEVSLADMLTTHLNSDTYLGHLQEFGPDERKRIIGLTLEYGVLHPDLFGIGKFLQGLKEVGGREDEAIAKSMADSIAKKLGVDLETEEGKDAIFSYYNEQTQINGVMYHGFNGTFRDAIERNGLATETRMWDTAELEKAEEIGRKSGERMLLGWRNINSEGKIFFEATPDNAYRYGVASPEWFAQFVSEGFHIKNERFIDY